MRQARVAAGRFEQHARSCQLAFALPWTRTQHIDRHKYASLGPVQDIRK